AWISDNPFHPSHKVYDGFGAIMNQTAEMSKHKFPSWFKMMGEYYLALCPFCGSLKTWNMNEGSLYDDEINIILHDYFSKCLFVNFGITLRRPLEFGYDAIFLWGVGNPFIDREASN